jgi:hypothetical protein
MSLSFFSFCALQMSVSCDRSFEYLQSLIQALDSDSQSYSVNDLVKLLLTSCIGSLRRGRSMSIVSIKQRKLSEFVGWLIQTRSDLCRTHFGGCLSWFVSLADHVLIDLQLSAEQKHLCMTSVRMLRSAASVSDPHFARSLVNRTGMSESVVLMLMANGGACNLLGSALQGMVCTMAEHWLQTLFSGRASKLVARFVFCHFTFFAHHICLLFMFVNGSECRPSRCRTPCNSWYSRSLPQSTRCATRKPSICRPRMACRRCVA